jgi:hypothetical protein
MTRRARISALAPEAGGHNRRRREATPKRVAGAEGRRARLGPSPAGRVVRPCAGVHPTTCLLVCYTIKHRVPFSLNQYTSALGLPGSVVTRLEAGLRVPQERVDRTALAETSWWAPPRV